MIFKLDHLALTTNDIEKDIVKLNEIGYTEIFSEKNLPNSEVKKPYLFDYKPFHHITLLQRHGSFPIELIQHSEECTLYQGYISPCQIIKNIGKESPVTIQFIEADMHPCGVFPDEFQAISLISSNLEFSAQFWSNFGFKLCRQGSHQAILRYKEIYTKMEYYIILNLGKSKEISFLDSYGLTCVAFVSDKIIEDRDKMKAEGLQVSAVGSLDVGGKRADFFFIVGPDHELIEVLGF